MPDHLTTDPVETWHRWCDSCEKQVSLAHPQTDPGTDEEWRQFRELDDVAFCSECHEYLGAYDWRQ